MPRGYNNYSFVIDSNFQPFTMQEMLTPFVMYKDAFDQAEAAYTDLSDKADTFKYLSDTLPEGSRAKEIYDEYANYLHEQAQDFAKHGLNMGNRRALTDLKRRYQGEIGRLSKADEALRQERELRRKLAAQDSSILYADDNLTIDSFLDNEIPNLYSISGNELYTKGAAAGKAASSRVYGAEDTGSTLGGYYRDYVQRMGYNADTIAKFRQDMSTIPELQMAADAILKANGVTSNLTGVNLDRARQQVINGMIDGAVYTESHNPQRDLGVLTESEKQEFALQREQMAKSAAQNGLFWNEKTNSWDYKIEKDPTYQRQNALAEKKAELEEAEGTDGTGGTKKSATTRDGLLEKPLRISFNSSMPARTEDGKKWVDVKAGADFEDDYTSDIIEPENVGSGKHYTYKQLPSFVKRKIPANLDYNKHLYIINEDNDIGGWGLLTPNRYTVTIVPVKTTISNKAGDNPTISSTITDTNFGFN